MNHPPDPVLSRRSFLQLSGLACTAATLRLGPASAGAAAGPAANASTAPVVDIGSRRELFVDDFLIERLVGRADLRLHHPQPREIVIEHDAPWENRGCGGHCLYQDDGLYRLYYTAWHSEGGRGKPGRGDLDAHGLCYAESTDGIHWRKPDLGLVEFRGSKANNIVIPGGGMNGLHLRLADASVFKDDNPAVSAGARYKALIRCRRRQGLIAFSSSDGIHWTPLKERPVIAAGPFAMQPLAFWDGRRGDYRAYWRDGAAGPTQEAAGGSGGDRPIRTSVSGDFITWSTPEAVSFPHAVSDVHLSTHPIRPYQRAPHLFIGLPLRHADRGWTDSARALPEPANRRRRARVNPRYGTTVTDSLLITSRDGVRFRRWEEAFLRPGLERAGTWNYGHQCLAWHIVETAADRDDGPGELSLYAMESYWTDRSSALRRYTLRPDGFVSVHAPASGGELLTRPLSFEGDALTLNFSTSAAGGIRVEIQDASGRPCPGYALEDCQVVYGDALERRVTWKNGADVSPLRAQPVRLRLALEDADLFALRFSPA